MDTTSPPIADPLEARQLRDAMVDAVLEAYTLSAQVQDAMRAVPRHLFVPEVALTDAYAAETIAVKHDAGGRVLSCASAPAIVAMMLQQLDVRPGDRILEFGAATGYNAALLRHLTGPTGTVTTLEVDPQLAPHAEAGLARAGYDDVEVVVADAALGWVAGAPYDGIIATVGAWTLPAVWLAQLAPGGRLVVPMRLRGSVSRSIAWAHGPNGWHSVSSHMCGFVPLRDGAANDPRRYVVLCDDGTVLLQVHQDQTVDPAALAGVLTTPAHEIRTGVVFAPMQSWEWMYLWISCHLPHGLFRMEVDTAAVDTGLVRPAFSSHTMATVIGGSLAYLTQYRFPNPADPTGPRMSEIAVVGHGGDQAAAALAEAVATWQRQVRGQTASFAVREPGSAVPSPTDQIVSIPSHTLQIAWS